MRLRFWNFVDFFPLAVISSAYFIAVDAYPWLVAHAFGLASGWGSALSLEPEMRVSMSRFILVGGVAFYGGLRALLRHPDTNSAYQMWLRATPWNGRSRLPLGPVELAWPDWLALCALYAIARFDSPIDPTWPVMAFGIAYLLFGALQMDTTRLTEISLIAFGLGGVVLAVGRDELVLLLLACTYIVFVVGSRCSMRAIPMSVLGKPKTASERFERRARARGTKRLGWPIDGIGPRHPELRATRSQAVLAGVLLTWEMYCVLHLVDDADAFGLSFFVASAVTIYAAFARWLIYCGRHRPPISLLGRIGTGRLIIPGYDYVYIGSIGTLVGASAILAVGYILRIPLTVSGPVAAGAALTAALGAGPSLDDWNLTGEHRIVPAGSSNRNLFVKA